MDRLLRLLNESRVGRLLSGIGNLGVLGAAVGALLGVGITVLTPLLSAPWYLQVIAIAATAFAGASGAGLLAAAWGPSSPTQQVRASLAGSAVAPMAELIADGRRLRTRLIATGLGEVDNESFTQWQGRVMGWVEKCEEGLADLAPDRAGAFRRPLYPLHPAHGQAEGMPQWAAAFLIELDEHLERLEAIRAGVADG